MTVSIIDALERRCKKLGFKVERSNQLNGERFRSLTVKSNKMFSRASINALCELADKYAANVRVAGPFIVSKPRGRKRR